MPTEYLTGIADCSTPGIAGSGAATLYADPITPLIRARVMADANVTRFCGARVWVYASGENEITPNIVIYKIADPRLAPICAGGIRYQITIRAPKGAASALEVIAVSVINALIGYTIKRSGVEINSVRYIDRQTYTEETTKNERCDLDFQVFYVLRN